MRTLDVKPEHLSNSEALQQAFILHCFPQLATCVYFPSRSERHWQYTKLSPHPKRRLRASQTFKFSKLGHRRREEQATRIEWRDIRGRRLLSRQQGKPAQCDHRHRGLLHDLPLAQCGLAHHHQLNRYAQYLLESRGRSATSTTMEGRRPTSMCLCDAGGGMSARFEKTARWSCPRTAQRGRQWSCRWGRMP